MKKIWLLCLCLASFSLVGCFHVPDEDWLPSKNNAETWNIQKDEEMEQALNSLMQWFDIISSDWNELKDIESDEIITKEIENVEVEDETINDEEITNDEIIEGVEKEVVEENISSEE